MYNNKLSREQISELAKESGAKSLFQDKYIEAIEGIDETNVRRQETLDLATRLKQDPWVFDLVKERFDSQLQPLIRQKQKFHRLLMMNTGNYKQLQSTFDLPALKQIPIETLFSPQNPRTTSNRTKCLCPFHKEKSPSFTIYHDTNSFHCFGCNQGGDNIAFVMKLNDHTFVEACKYINNQ
jgi:hypothetical protein